MLNYIGRPDLTSFSRPRLRRPRRSPATGTERPALPLRCVFTETYDSATGGCRRDPDRSGAVRDLLRTEEKPAASYPGYLLQTREGTSSASRPAPNFPSRWPRSPRSRARATRSCRRLEGFSPLAAAQAPGHGDSRRAGCLRAGPVRQLNAIAAAALDFAKTAAGIAVGLVGVLAFSWPAQIARRGDVHPWSSWSGPSFARSFPEIPRDHPRFSADPLNLAATLRTRNRHPFGISDGGAADAEPVEGHRTNSMVMLLAMNTPRTNRAAGARCSRSSGSRFNRLIFRSSARRDCRSSSRSRPPGSSAASRVPATPDPNRNPPAPAAPRRPEAAMDTVRNAINLVSTHHPVDAGGFRSTASTSAVFFYFFLPVAFFCFLFAARRTSLRELRR